MKEAILAALGSKKALAAIAGVLVGLAAKKGLNLDTESVLAILSPVVAYILGQAHVDGKKVA